MPSTIYFDGLRKKRDKEETQVTSLQPGYNYDGSKYRRKQELYYLAAGFQSTLPKLSSTPNNCLIVGKNSIPHVNINYQIIYLHLK